MGQKGGLTPETSQGPAKEVREAPEMGTPSEKTPLPSAGSPGPFLDPDDLPAGSSLAQCQAWDPATAEREMEDLLHRMLPRLKMILNRQGIPAQDQEDVLQQLFVIFVNKRPSIQSPEGWLCGTLYKRCIMYWREVRASRYDSVDHPTLELLSDHEPPSQESVEARWDLERRLQRLPPRYQEVLRLRYFYGYTAEEIAEQVGYRALSVEKVIDRALRLLAEELAAEAPGVEDYDLEEMERPGELKGGV